MEAIDLEELKVRVGVWEIEGYVYRETRKMEIDREELRLRVRDTVL